MATPTDLLILKVVVKAADTQLSPIATVKDIAREQRLKMLSSARKC